MLDQHVDAQLGQHQGVLTGGSTWPDMTVLLAKPAGFGHGQPAGSCTGNGTHDIVQLARLDDRGDQLHCARLPHRDGLPAG